MAKGMVLGIASLLSLAACAASAEEMRGDTLLASGDKTGAAEEYRRALLQKPIMDYEYERIRDKRRAIVGEQFEDKVAVATSATGDVFARLETQLTTRHEARAARAPKETVVPLERAVLETAKDDFAAHEQSEALPRTNRILDALRTARSQQAPQQVFDALLAALEKTLHLGLAPKSQADVAFVSGLVDLVDSMTALGVPEATVWLAKESFGQLPAPVAPSVTAENAQSVFDAASTLRKRLTQIGAAAPALAIARAAQEAALPQLTIPVDAKLAEHHYLAALAQLEPLIKQVDLDHPLRQRVRKTLADASAWHASQAAALPVGYRKLLQYDLQGMFGGPSTEGGALATQLAPDSTTQLAIKPTVSGDCGAANDVMSRGVTSSTGREARVRIQMSCSSDLSTTTEAKSISYYAEEQVQQQEPYEVKDRTWGQVGSHQEQCSKDSSLEGYTWQGVCTVPDMGWIESSHTEYRTITVTVPTTKQFDYTVEHRFASVRISGSASYTWDDGTVLTVPLAIDRRDESQAYAYNAPSATKGGPAQIANRTHDPSFGVATTTVTATSSLASELVTKLHATVRAHRAHLARAEGTAALARGDEAAAGEAFIRSARLDGNKVEAEAEAWFARAHALTKTQAESVLAGTTWTMPAPEEMGPRNVAAGEKLVATGDGYDSDMSDIDKDVSSVTQDTYQSGIKPPNEYVHAHIGAMPTNVKTFDGSTTTVTVGMDLSYGVLGMAAPRYGFTWHDEASFRVAFGVKRNGIDYANGEEEGKLAWGIEPAYKLYVGIRHHYFSLFGGGGIGWIRMRAGGTLAKGGHFEPGARLLLRVAHINNLVIEGSGFVASIGDWARKDRLAIGIPLSKSSNVELLLTYERTKLPTTSLLQDGTTEMSLGKQDVQQFGVQFGARL